MDEPPDIGRRVPTRLVQFGTALRRHGVIVGTSELLDAARAIDVLGLTDRDQLRAGLAATLLRRAGERQVFDDLFDVFFPAALGARLTVGGAPLVDLPPTQDAAEKRSRAAALLDELARALASGDDRALDAAAARAVAELGVMDPRYGPAFSASAALDALMPRTAIAAALAHAADAGRDVPGGSGDGSGGSGPGAAGAGAGAGARSGAGSGAGAGLGPDGVPQFADRFLRDELRSRVAAFTRRVEVEARRRNAEARGVERIAHHAVRSPDEDLFVLSNAKDIAELRRTIDPLSRKLATRMAARRRRAARGTIDLRRTLRRSLGTGGVPVRPAYEHAHVGRPDLVLLCDMSSSVAGFSRFTILLMQELATQFRRIRIFGFVNVCEELTRTIIESPPGTDLSAAFNDISRMTRMHRASDYGSALTDFVEHHLDAVGHRTAVLVLGDARTNRTDPQFEMLRIIAEQARHVSWLNPEPASGWGSGDSVATGYAQIVDMHECRNVAQLRAFVARVLPV